MSNEAKNAEPTISTADALDIFAREPWYTDVRSEGPAVFIHGKYKGVIGIRVTMIATNGDAYRGIEPGQRVGFVAIRRPNGKRWHGWDAETWALIEGRAGR